MTRLTCLTVVLSVVACTKPTHISIDPKQPLIKGRLESVQLIGHVMTNKVEDAMAHVTWRSEDPAIAAVDEMGKVSGKGSGRTQIVATFGELTASVPVEVSWVEQVRASADRVELSIEAGDPAKVTVEGLGFDGRVLKDRVLSWKAENETICRADPSGQIWPVGEGEADVVASFDDQHQARIHCVVKKK